MRRSPPSIRLVAIGRYTNSVAKGSAWIRAYSLQPRPYSSSVRTLPRTNLRSQCLSNPISTTLFWRLRTVGASKSYVTEPNASESTIQGTIGKDASAVPEEARRVKERLQAPDHLNEKEKMIFEKLEKELDPVKLEVCHATTKLRTLAPRC